MKKWCWILCFVTLSIWGNPYNYPSTPKKDWTLTVTEKRIRDSIFQETQGQVTISDRITLLRSSFEEGKEYTKEFLDSALVWALRAGDLMEQSRLHLCFFEYYETRYERKKMEEAFVNLKELVQKHPESDLSAPYFRVWVALAQKRMLEGCVEEAKFEAIEMLKEAEKLNSNDGRFYSYFLSSFTYFQTQTEESDTICLSFLKKARSIPNLTFMQQRWLLSRYYSYYMRHNQVEGARSCLRSELILLKKEIAAYPNTLLRLQSVFLRNDMRMATLFSEENKMDSVKIYLERASKYYLNGSYNPSYMNYQYQWVNYYYKSAQLDNTLTHLTEALNHCDEALENGRFLYPIHRLDMNLFKAKILKELGRTKESATLYRETVLCRDSLNEVALRSHVEAHEKNFKIKQLLQSQVSHKRVIYRIILFVSSLLLVILAFLLYHMLPLERKIRKKKREIQELYKRAESANRLKNTFLNRIVGELQTPLDRVIRCAEALSDSSKLSAEERTIYSGEIKIYASKLLNLVLNVLEFSRLEAGMVKFEWVQLDLFLLAQEVKREVEYAMESAIQIEIVSTLPNILLVADECYLKKVLLNLVKPSSKLVNEQQVQIQIVVNQEDIRLCVNHSPLFARPGEEVEIIHQINETIVKQLKGDYLLLGEKEEIQLHFVSRLING